MQRLTRAVLLPILAFLSACSSGGGGGGAPAPVEAAGLWRGEWIDDISSPPNRYDLEFHLDVMPTGEVVGTSLLVNLGCMPVNAPVGGGEVDEVARTISGAVRAPGGPPFFEYGRFTGTVADNGAFMSGSIWVGTQPGTSCYSPDPPPVPFVATKQPVPLRAVETRYVLVFDGAQLVGEMEIVAR